MPRDGSGVYSLPNAAFTPNTAISSTAVNGDFADLVQDANAARPLSAGGTGAESAMAAWDVFSAAGIDIASAGTTDLDHATGPVVNISGTSAISAVTLGAGKTRIVKATDAWSLTASSTLVVNGSTSVDYTATAGDLLFFVGETGKVRAWSVPTLPSLGSSADLDVAADADVYAAASDKVMTTDLIESASTLVALTDAATVAVDWDTAVNFSLTVTADRAIGNPTNGQPGTWRTILVQASDTTARTITFGSDFLGDVPTIADCTSTKWYLLSIFCVTSSHFVVSAKQAK